MSKKDLVTQEDKKWITNPEKWITLKEEKSFRENVADIFEPSCSPNVKYKRGKELAQKLVKDRKSFTDEENKEFSDIVISINTTTTHRLLMETMRETTDRTAIAEYADDLIKEYWCTGVSERALCEVVALSYFSLMKTSREMNKHYDWTYYSNERSNMLSVLSKDLEKQNRMYLTSLQTLRTLKSPFWGMKINAKNAFIGDNQQFNNNNTSLWENQ